MTKETSYYKLIIFAVIFFIVGFGFGFSFGTENAIDWCVNTAKTFINFSELNINEQMITEYRYRAGG